MASPPPSPKKKPPSVRGADDADVVTSDARTISIDVTERPSQETQSMADLDQLEALHLAAAEDIDDALNEYRTKGSRRAAKKRKAAILTVFLEGTANTINPPTTQVGLFAAACVATDISIEAPTADSPSSESTALFKMMFDGCGVSHGVSGLLFGSGLRDQAAKVRRALEDLVKIYGAPVRCNVLGLSRGGIAAIYLAQSLGELPPGAAELNVLAFDPVPGDQTWSGFPYTGAYARDCGTCRCLKRVLALYPHEPLPDITFHAPVLVRWPDSARVEEDVTLGCHQGALFATRRSNHPVHVASNLAFRRVVNFLEECGTRLALDRCFAYQPSDEDCLKICRVTLAEAPQATKRQLHDGCSQGRVIVRRRAGRYLNKYHMSLEGPREDPADLLAPIQDDGMPDVHDADERLPKPKFMLDIDAPSFQRSCGF